MGQDHIVNAFMTVVVGGVGSLVGTVISALGIGVADQSLQQVLESRPGQDPRARGHHPLPPVEARPGFFVTKSRSLES